MTAAFLRTAVVARMLGVSERTVRRMVARGDLRRADIPTHAIYIPASDVDEFVRTQTERRRRQEDRS